LLLYRSIPAQQISTTGVNMLIKDQIRARREQLGISVAELAKRVGVSGQAIRHWESGRSFPGKSKAPDVETALSFTLDWTEGRKAVAAQPQMAALIEQGDIELLLLLCRLPTPFKVLMAELAKAQLDAILGKREGFTSKETEQPQQAFSQKERKNAAAVPHPAKLAKRAGPRKKAA
jgi:transcriptional regulator with XRE-family HTH domain